MSKRILAALLTAVTLTCLCACDAGLVRPDVDMKATPTPSATQKPSPTVPPTPEPTINPRITLEGTQLTDFAVYVGSPLVLTAWQQIGFGDGGEEIVLGEQDSAFWDSFFTNLLLTVSDTEELFGPGNVSANLGFLASEIWPDSYSRGTDDFIVRGDVIKTKAIQTYLKNAFGDSAPETPGGLIPQGQDGYLYIQDESAAVTVTPAEIPSSCTTTPDGIISLKYVVHIAGDTTDEEFMFRGRLLKDESSPFGCTVTSYSITFAGDREAVPEPTPAIVAATPIPAATPPVPQPAGSPASGSAGGFDANGFVFADSSTRLLTASDLENLSLEMLGFARNEIFARHGNEFQRDIYRNHYSQFAWYQALNRRPDISTEELNSIELANVELIQQYEAARRG